MKDQAATLRQLMKPNSVPVFTFSSGKGGVGKSSLVANLGALLAKQGMRVLCIDADYGLSNLAILFGVEAPKTLEQVLDGRIAIKDAMVLVAPQLWLVSSQSGYSKDRSHASDAKVDLSRLLSVLPWQFDAILMDIGAGISHRVLESHRPEYQSVIVVTPEPTSLADAYGLMKILSRDYGMEQFQVIVNRTSSPTQAKATFDRLESVCSQFLDVQVSLLGQCTAEEKFSQAVIRRQILIDWCMEGEAYASLVHLGERLSQRIEDIANSVSERASGRSEERV